MNAVQFRTFSGMPFHCGHGIAVELHSVQCNKFLSRNAHPSHHNYHRIESDKVMMTYLMCHIKYLETNCKNINIALIMNHLKIKIHLT